MFCRSYMSTDIAAVANVTETEKSLWSEFVVGTRIASAVRCSMFIYYWSEQFCDVFFPPRSCKWAVTCLIQYTTETSTIVKHEQIQVYCYLKSRSTTCQQQAAIHGLETCKHHQKSETKWTYLVVLVFAFFCRTYFQCNANDSRKTSKQQKQGRFFLNPWAKMESHEKV